MSEGNIELSQPSVNIKANKAVIICTGGSTGNLEFRTMFDPRLGPEFDGLGGMPFSDQDASGELAAMDIGAALGSAAGYANDAGGWLTTPQRFGCQYGYGKGYSKDSAIWPLVRANGIKPDFDSLVIVNMLGYRCGNEDDYNTNKYVEDRFRFFNTALSSVFIDPDGDGNAEALGGPIWAIFDADAVARNDWKMEQGIVDFDAGYAFKGDTLEELVQNIINKYYENIKMDPDVLVETIRKWNEAVDKGYDDEWGRANPINKIEKGPFYALWAVPSLHDTLAGLRVNGAMQVIDRRGAVIPNLFCAGEAQGAMRIHGLGRVMTSGYVAGMATASVNEEGMATCSLELDSEYAGPETNERTQIVNRYDVTNVNGLTKQEVDAQKAAAKAAKEAEEAAKAEAEADIDVIKFTGTSDNGMGGAIQIEISVKDDQIVAIDVLKQSETAGIGDVAFETLVPQALEAQGADIDGVAGATITTDAFKEALEIAIGKSEAK
ncbi:MAG: FAD-binding protein [Clostridia bacterium]|nr:FAD-binding protein [Clostridia bacterium]